jgi:general secretion pathway protein E
MIELSELLQNSFSINNSDLEKAKSYQSRYDGRLEQILVNMGCLTEDDLAPLYSQLLEYPLFDADVWPNWQLPDINIGVLSQLKSLDCVLLNITESSWILAARSIQH